MNPQQTKGLTDLIEHLDEFWSAAKRLGTRLIEEGHANLGRVLLANARSHDKSKFFGVEWDCLVMKERPELLKYAVEQHNRSNPHHPEYWGSIHEMDDVHLSEMLCDWKARSVKFGTSLRDWINNEAMERFHFTKDDPVYNRLMRFVSLLLDEPFKKL